MNYSSTDTSHNNWLEDENKGSRATRGMDNLSKEKS